MCFVVPSVCTVEQVFGERWQGAVIGKKLESFLLGSFCWNFFSSSGSLPLSAFNRPGTQKILFCNERLDIQHVCFSLVNLHLSPPVSYDRDIEFLEAWKRLYAIATFITDLT